MENKNDLNDLLTFIKTNRRWYWYIPIIGFIISETKFSIFYKKNKYNVKEVKELNPKYEYIEIKNGVATTYRPKRFHAIIKRYIKFFKYTFFIGFILSNAFQFIFNYGPSLMKRMIETELKK